MKQIFEFVVLDPPTPMGRKRWSGVGKNGGRFYTENKDIRSVHHIRKAFDEHYHDVLPIQARVPVLLSVRMWHRCPKTMSKKSDWKLGCARW